MAVNGHRVNDQKKNCLLEVKNLKKYFPVSAGFFNKEKKHLKAVDGVDFKIHSGETLGLVGESGSGKSTTGYTIIRLLDPTEGQIIFNGTDVSGLKEKNMRALRSDIQMIFQDPFSSLNPRMIVKDIIGRVLMVQGEKKQANVAAKVLSTLNEVGLKEEHMTRYPHEFSGGQRQRIAIARALISDPDFIVLDEPTSALDVSVQAQILNLLKVLQNEKGLTYLFITHDLSVVKHMSHKVLVIYLGKAMEYASKNAIFSSPLHPYTKALLTSIPKPYITNESIEDKIIRGDIPSPSNPPKGCRFHNRCPFAEEICKKREPCWREIQEGHFVACHKV